MTRWPLRWKALAKKLRRTVQNWEDTHLQEIDSINATLTREWSAQTMLRQELKASRAAHENAIVERDNLQFRLSLVTQDPESLASQLLSKHNALRMARENLSNAQAERDAARKRERENLADAKELDGKYLAEFRAHAETRKALEKLRAKYDTDLSNAEVAHQLELAKAEARVKEATDLLVLVDDALESDGPWLALQAQLRHWLATHAPAQPAAPTPEREYTWDGYALPMMTAAPEPSAERTSTAVRMHDAVARAESAEAQLAAVLAACLEVCPNGRSSVHISTAVLWPLLAPAATPGAGEKT